MKIAIIRSLTLDETRAVGVSSLGDKEEVFNHPPLREGRLMFVLEVLFKSPPISREVVFVKRPSSLLGASEDANISLDELSELGCDIRITRQLGRSFRLSPEGKGEPNYRLQSAIDGIFDKEAELNLEKVSLRIIAIDSDLFMREEETPDRAGVRILRQAFSRPSPRFPALRVEQQGKPSFCISFAEGSALLIGRGSDCSVRIDSPEISSHHARIGFEDNSFWVEDLGSTNGTFIADKQISSRTPMLPSQTVRLAYNVYLIGQISVDTSLGRREQGEIRSMDGALPSPTNTPSDPQVGQNIAELATPKFPCLVSVSELCRPARVALKQGARVQIGREQGCDMWLGAPHVSRHHAEVILNPGGSVSFSDISTNGTKFDGGFLKRGDILTIQQEPRVFDFGEGVTVAICFDEAQEERYRISQGELTIFRRKVTPRQHLKGVSDSGAVQASINSFYKKKGKFGRTHSTIRTFWVSQAYATVEALGALGTTLIFISFSLILAILFMLWSQF